MLDNAAIQGANNGPIFAPQTEAPPIALPLEAQRAPVSEGLSRVLNAATPAGPTASGERELVASEDSVQAGGVRDAYDMKLYREPDGSQTLELNMAIEFDFTTGPDGQTWTPESKQQFIDDYKAAVEATWNGHTLTSDTGEQVKLDVNLDVTEKDSVADNENWGIEVVKIDEGGFNGSYVQYDSRGNNGGRFDSEDVNPINKGASDPQVGAAHEFGHMIGLLDEYNGDSGPDAAKDTDSVMHTGMDLRDRHLDIAEGWLNANNEEPATLQPTNAPIPV